LELNDKGIILTRAHREKRNSEIALFVPLQLFRKTVNGLIKFARRDEDELIDEVDVNTIIDESARLVHNQVHKYAEIELDLAQWGDNVYNPYSRIQKGK